MINPGSFFFLSLFIIMQLEEMMGFLLFIYERTELWAVK